MGLLLVSLGKGFEHLANGADSGGDLLRMLGVIGIGIVTVAADVTAENNKVKASNKLSAVEEAEKAGALHFRHTYPFV
ncbi:MAG TPA: hypothetical protein VES68_03535 [Candidatus Sulfotelmatobacter sp.]|nr:hypothetical protein [Candidatus Sulfotelmatobacter sp.]